MNWLLLITIWFVSGVFLMVIWKEGKKHYPEEWKEEEDKWNWDAWTSGFDLNKMMKYLCWAPLLNTAFLVWMLISVIFTKDK